MHTLPTGDDLPAAQTPTRQDLAQGLAGVLADTVTLHYLGHGFHWNVKGPNFHQFHDFFSMIYQDYADAEDDIAEAIRRLGFDAPHLLTEFVELTCVESRRVAGDPLEMTAVLYEGNLMSLKRLQEVVDLAQLLNEQDIVNLIAERIDKHNKWKWQLGVTIGADVTQVNSLIIQDADILPPIDMGKSKAELSLIADSDSLSVEAQPLADLINYNGNDGIFSIEEVDFSSSAPVFDSNSDPIFEESEDLVIENRKLTFSNRTEQLLQEKVEKHNASVEFSDKKVTIDQAKAVYRRGVTEFVANFGSIGDFNSAGLERLSNFLHLVKSGAPKLSSYVSDNDLLPDSHPKTTNDSLVGLTASANADKELLVEVKPEQFYKNPEEIIFAMAEFSGLGYETIPAFRASWKRAVAKSENPYKRVTDLAVNLYNSKDADLLPIMESNI